MHLKVVNSTNINDPLTIFESQQFQNRQTDSKNSSRLNVCIFQHIDVQQWGGKWQFYMSGLSLFDVARENQKQYTAGMTPQLLIHDDMTQICYISKA